MVQMIHDLQPISQLFQSKINRLEYSAKCVKYNVYHFSLTLQLLHCVRKEKKKKKHKHTSAGHENRCTHNAC